MSTQEASNTALQLFNQTKQQMNLDSIKDPMRKAQSTAQMVLKGLFYGRVGISLIIIGWLTYVLYKLKPTEQDTPEGTASRARYYDMHRVFFGDQSVVMILFSMWYYSFILILLSPVLKWVADVLKLYLAGGRLLG